MEQTGSLQHAVRSLYTYTELQYSSFIGIYDHIFTVGHVLDFRNLSGFFFPFLFKRSKSEFSDDFRDAKWPGYGQKESPAQRAHFCTATKYQATRSSSGAKRGRHWRRRKHYQLWQTDVLAVVFFGTAGSETKNVLQEPKIQWLDQNLAQNYWCFGEEDRTWNTLEEVQVFLEQFVLRHTVGEAKVLLTNVGLQFQVRSVLFCAGQYWVMSRPLDVWSRFDLCKL